MYSDKGTNLLEKPLILFISAIIIVISVAIAFYPWIIQAGEIQFSYLLLGAIFAFILLFIGAFFIKKHKHCPFCNESGISIDAIFCPYCGKKF